MKSISSILAQSRVKNGFPFPKRGRTFLKIYRKRSPFMTVKGLLESFLPSGEAAPKVKGGASLGK